MGQKNLGTEGHKCGGSVEYTKTNCGGAPKQNTRAQGAPEAGSQFVQGGPEAELTLAEVSCGTKGRGTPKQDNTRAEGS